MTMEGESGVQAVAELEARSIQTLIDESDLDVKASLIAAVTLGTIGLLLDQTIGLLLGILIIVCLGVRRIEVVALRRGNVTAGVAWHTAGTWSVSLGVVALVPAALPLMVVNLLGPLVTAAMYLRREAATRITVAGLAVAVVLGMLGFTRSGRGFASDVPDGLFQLITITYLVGHVGLVASNFRRANTTRLLALRALATSNDELRATQADLQQSNRRVIAAADDERVRIERNIHDGAQQRLVTLAVQLHLAAQLVENGATVQSGQLHDLHQETLEAIAEIRDLAAGIYPAALANRGLADALRSLGRRAEQDLILHVDNDLGLTVDDEAAVYFVCAEAIQNVAKHAGEHTTTTVRVHRNGDVISIEIVDDGIGFDPAAGRQTRGLANMQDRINALGGALTIRSAVGAGTKMGATFRLGDDETNDETSDGSRKLEEAHL